MNAPVPPFRARLAPPAVPRTLVLETRRMLMHEFQSGDESNLMALHRDERVTRLLVDGAPRTLLDAFVFIRWLSRIYRERPGLGIWRASDRESGEFLGFFSLMYNPAIDDVEIGGRLRPCAWGRHLAVEGGRALLQHGFADLDLSRIVATCHPENRPVDFVLTRLGFVRDHARCVTEGSAPWYALEQDAWRARQSAQPCGHGSAARAAP